MSTTHPNDILLPASADSPDRPAHSRLVAFVPITIAAIGVAAIIAGRVTVQEIAATDAAFGVDPVTTGSIQAIQAAD